MLKRNSKYQSYNLPHSRNKSYIIIIKLFLVNYKLIEHDLNMSDHWMIPFKIYIIYGLDIPDDSCFKLTQILTAANAL
jgi:hypothetical protein